MTISLLKDDTRLTPTSQYLSNNLAVLFFINQARLAILVGIVCLVFGNFVAAAVFVFSGAIFLLSERVRRSRRYFVEPHLRAPRYPEISAFLLRIDWRMIGIVKVAFPTVASYVVVPVQSLFSWDIFLFLLTALLLNPILGVGVLSLLKYRLDKNFRIVVFRRNRAETNQIHKSVIMPACGMIGQNLLIYDDSLSALQEGGQKRVDMWWQSEMYHPLVVGEGQHWRQVVMIELSFADLAVLDWSGEVTDNMRWELCQAVMCLPYQRILVLVSDSTLLTAEDEAYLQQHPVKVVPYPDGPVEIVKFKRLMIALVVLLEDGPRPDVALRRRETMSRHVDLDRIDWTAFETGQPPL